MSNSLQYVSIILYFHVIPRKPNEMSPQTRDEDSLVWLKWAEIENNSRFFTCTHFYLSSTNFSELLSAFVLMSHVLSCSCETTSLVAAVLRYPRHGSNLGKWGDVVITQWIKSGETKPTPNAIKPQTSPKTEECYTKTKKCYLTFTSDCRIYCLLLMSSDWFPHFLLFCSCERLSLVDVVVLSLPAAGYESILPEQNDFASSGLGVGWVRNQNKSRQKRTQEIK